MERFRLRVRHEPKRGTVWELKLFPDNPKRIFREADGRSLGEIASPESVLWLRKIAEPFMLHADEPVEAESFGPESDPCWLRPEDGMRLALAFSAARWLVRMKQRRMFREGLEDLPSEVVLYWFTLCYYGYRQAAGRAALRTLLAYEGPEGDEPAILPAGRRVGGVAGPSLFDNGLDAPRNGQTIDEPTPKEIPAPVDPGQAARDLADLVKKGPAEVQAKTEAAKLAKAAKPKAPKTSRGRKQTGRSGKKR